MLSILVLVLSIALVACGGSDGSSNEPNASASSPASGPASVVLAPEFGEFDGWYNSAPLTLDALRGSPVLLVFWSDT